MDKLRKIIYNLLYKVSYNINLLRFKITKLGIVNCYNCVQCLDFRDIYMNSSLKPIDFGKCRAMQDYLESIELLMTIDLIVANLHYESRGREDEFSQDSINTIIGLADRLKYFKKENDSNKEQKV